MIATQTKKTPDKTANRDGQTPTKNRQKINKPRSDHTTMLCVWYGIVAGALNGPVGHLVTGGGGECGRVACDFDGNYGRLMEIARICAEYVCA